MDNYCSSQRRDRLLRYLSFGRIIGAIFIVLLLLVLTLVVYLPRDEKAAALTQEWRSKIDKLGPADLEPFYYLLGFLAPADTDPIEYGKAIVAQNKQSSAPEQKTQAAQLPLPEQPEKLDCELNTSDCQELLFGALAYWKKTLDTHQLLLERYDRFLQYSSYSEPRFSITSAHAHVMTSVAKLSRVRALLTAAEGYSEQSVAKLSDELEKMRLQISQSNNQLHRSMLTVSAHSLLETMIDLHQVFGVKPERIPQPLSPSEQSQQLVFLENFRALHHREVALDTTRANITKQNWFDRWLSASMMQQVRTENAVVRAFATKTAKTRSHHAASVETSSNLKQLLHTLRNAKGAEIVQLLSYSPLPRDRQKTQRFEISLNEYIARLEQSKIY